MRQLYLILNYWTNLHRFSVMQILELVDALDIPDPFTTCNQYSFTAIEALGLLLTCFHSGLDLFDLCSQYDCCQSSLSALINELTEFIDERWKHLLECDRNHMLHLDQLLIYAAAIAAQGVPLHNCVTFLDCTICKTCRPVIGQESIFSGYKRYHALKYQALTIPNGLIVHLCGPFEGRHNDNHLLATSKILDQFAEFAFWPDLPVNAPAHQQNFIIFGDPAYGYGPHLASPFAKDDISDEEKEWNFEMSQVRIEVEHGFGVVVNLWPFLDIFCKMQVLLSPVGCYYQVGVLLLNALNCLQPNQIAQVFDLLPPTLQDYFHD